MWSILFTVFSTLIIVMFFFTIYMGSSYLQDHIQVNITPLIVGFDALLFNDSIFIIGG